MSTSTATHLLDQFSDESLYIKDDYDFEDLKFCEESRRVFEEFSDQDYMDYVDDLIESYSHEFSKYDPSQVVACTARSTKLFFN